MKQAAAAARVSARQVLVMRVRLVYVLLAALGAAVMLHILGGTPPAFQTHWGYWSNDRHAAMVGISSFEYPALPREPAYGEQAYNWPMVLQRCRNHVLAQGRQDGILLCIFAAIGFTNRFFVEFGHTDLYESNAGLLYYLGWRGLFLDGDHEDARYNSHRAYIEAKSICGTLEKHSVPKAFDYLSADLDSLEFYVVHEILRCGYRPRVFSIEYNCHVPLQHNLTVDTEAGKRWNKGCYYGLSLGAAVALAEHWGYTLVAVDVALDAFFVAGDLLPAGAVVPSKESLHAHLCLHQPLHPCSSWDALRRMPWIDASAYLRANP